MTANIFDQDSFTLSVDVVQQPGNTPFNLTGVVLEAFAESGDGAIIEGDVSVQSAATGSLRVSFPPETFSEGFYTLQVRAAYDGQVQTVLADYVINVARSIGD